MWRISILFALFLLPFALQAQDKPELKLGGALRFNYNLSDWKDGQVKRGGDFGYDMFRVNANGKYKGVTINAEYRLYSDGFGGGFLKQGWFGYEFDENNEIQLGLTQVPFGVSGYNSNSFFFSMDFYVGLEDDHDMGLKYIRKVGNWRFDLAFFKNAEELGFGSNSDLSSSRYAYDVSSITKGDGKKAYRNKEVNQLNGRAIYTFGESLAKHRLGASALYGGLYNLETEDMGSHYAFALHYHLTYGRWNMKAQWATYGYDPANPDGEDDDRIAMTAFGAPYLVAAKADVYTVGLAYDIPMELGPISSIRLYNDFGMLAKKEESFKDSYMNVAGAMVTAGRLYTYIDYAMGKNQPWLGKEWTNALTTGAEEEEWSARFNINFGYYF